MRHYSKSPLLSTYKRRLPSPHFNNTQDKKEQSKSKSNTTEWAYALASSRREIRRDVREEFGEEVLGLLVTFPCFYLGECWLCTSTGI